MELSLFWPIAEDLRKHWFSYLAGGVILLYVKPIFQAPPPHNYCTVSNFRIHFYAFFDFFVSLLGTSLFFFSFFLFLKYPILVL